LFDVERAVSKPIEPRQGSAGDRLVDTHVWAPVLDHVYGRAVPANHPFRAVGFERENLALNIGHRYRSDLLSLMYGGAAARFSNPKLCEMFARLVTGRKVERTLVMGVTERIGAEPRIVERKFPRLDFDPALRGPLLRAMTAVAERGTARALRDSLLKIDARLDARGCALGFFAKTGSPRNTITVPSGLSRAVNVLIRSGAVALNARGVLAYRGIPVTQDPEGPAVPASLVALRAHAADLDVLRRHGVSSRLVHDALVLYNVEPDERRHLIFSARDGKLYSMKGVRELPATGAVFVFGIGIYDAAARRSQTPLDVDAVAHTPRQAWTVAINIEGQGGSKEVAVPFAADLLEDVIWPALERGIP
jgi:hypothetical protein